MMRWFLSAGSFLMPKGAVVPMNFPCFARMAFPVLTFLEMSRE
jgi:hypothetical protein